MKSLHLLWSHIIVFVSIFSDVLSVTQSQTELHVTSSITALTDDVTVVISLPTAGTVELSRNNQIISGQMVATSTSKEMSLVFDCGYFSRLGEYIFQFRPKIKQDRGTPPTATTNVVQWPNVSLDWKGQHDALTTDVKIDVKSSSKLCKSDIAKKHQLAVRLLQTPDMNSEDVVAGLQYQASKVVKSITDIELPPSSLIFPCEQFDRAGKYRTEVVMTSEGEDDVTIVLSPQMEVYWSREYGIKIPEDISGCRDEEIIISFSVPPCVSTYDVIAVNSYLGNTSRLIANKTIEFSAMVSFPCSIFKIDVDGFCFNYITNTGHVARSVCQSVGNKNFTVPGAWSGWSAWSSCKQPCVGKIMRRKRKCDNPYPEGRGRECLSNKGNYGLYEFDSNITKSNMCPYIPITPALLRVAPTSDCGCGCNIINQMEGLIIPSVMNKCSRNNLIWTVRVPKGHLIRFRLDDYQLNRDELLSVRDGQISWPLTPQYRVAVTRLDMVIVQLVTKQNVDEFSSCGFVLYFEAIVAPTRRSLPDTSAQRTTGRAGGEGNLISGIQIWFQEAVADNPVLLGSISALALILIIVIILVVGCHRRRRRVVRKNSLSMSRCESHRLSTPPDGRSCSTESEPMMRSQPTGDSDNCEGVSEIGGAHPASVKPGTAYYLAQRQFQLMKQMGQNESTQLYATLGVNDRIRDQSDLMFGTVPRRKPSNREDKVNEAPIIL